MYVIAGLGNPGRKYENTKHNMGFLTIDVFAENHGIKVNRIKHKALIGEGFIGGHKVMLVKPQTYMNLSGESLREIVNYYDVEPENIMVVYDDIDIPAGAIRMRKKGSAGTHNGMKSIVYNLQFDNFPRLRIGIGSDKKEDMIDFVLTGFTGKEKDMVAEAIKNGAAALTAWIEKGIDIAMGEYNTKKEKKPKQKPEKQVDEKPDAEKAAEGAEQRTEEPVKDEVDNGKQIPQNDQQHTTE